MPDHLLNFETLINLYLVPFGLKVIAAIVMAIVGCFYYLRVVKAMYFDAPADKSALALPQDLPLRWLLSINGMALLVLGVLWGPLIGWCYRAFGL